MKRTFLLSAALLLLMMPGAAAQTVEESGDPHAERFMNDARKNAAYLKFQSELNKIIRSARGKNNRAAAARALFKRNTTMLRELYRGAGVAAPQSTERFIVHKPESMAIHNSILKQKIKLPLALNFTKTRGYDFSWQKTAFSNGNMPMPFDTAGSSLRAGKQVITSTTYCTTPSYCYLGLYQRGFGERITIPSNPQVIAAQVRFDYEFDYDAWDSYGAISGVDLIVQASPNFNSTSYMELPTYFGGSSWSDGFKKLATLMQPDTITSYFGEFHATANSSVTIEGYVTPGSEVEFRFGFSFPKGTHKGTNGNYHYAEFLLKKITVTYYKTGQ